MNIPIYYGVKGKVYLNGVPHNSGLFIKVLSGIHAYSYLKLMLQCNVIFFSVYKLERNHSLSYHGVDTVRMIGEDDFPQFSQPLTLQVGLH